MIGKTGTGKSTGARNLDPKQTFIINCLNKPLPFKGSAKLYNKDNKNIGVSTDFNQIVNTLEAIDKNRPEIKHVIIDDAGYVMNTEMFETAQEKGYDKFTRIAQHMYFILNAAKSLRSDLDIVLVFHQEDIVIDGMNVEADIKLPGRMIRERFNPIEISTVVVFTDVEYAKDKDEEYTYVVNKTARYPLAKTPMGMFETKTIPNDMKLLFDGIRKYYESE